MPISAPISKKRGSRPGRRRGESQSRSTFNGSKESHHVVQLIRRKNLTFQSARSVCSGSLGRKHLRNKTSQRRQGSRFKSILSVAQRRSAAFPQSTQLGGICFQCAAARERRGRRQDLWSGGGIFVASHG